MPIPTVSRAEALETILEFSAEYDRAMKQDVALGLLMIAGAFRAPGEDVESLALRVGAQMCGIIRDDVILDTFSGKMRLLDSQADAARLLTLVQSDDTAALPDHWALKYITARWHDAAGRLWYRIGNHTRALVITGIGLALVEQAPTLWWCWADMKSNSLRMQQEADKQVGRKSSVGVRDYDDAIATATHLFAQHGANAMKRRRIEHLRGIWNLHHNRMVTRGAAALSDSLAELDAIERELQGLLPPDAPIDPYRQAQTINQHALLLKTRGLEQKSMADLARSRERYEALLSLPWPRGQFFARQHLSHLQQLLGGPAEEAEGQILALCAEVQVEQERPGGREGFDLDRYYWMVDITRKMLGTDDPRVSEHDLGVSRAIQSVAGVASYKSAAQRFVLPSLQRAVARHLNAAERVESERERLHQVDEAVALLEESSARELLDLLGARHDADSTANDVFVAVPEFDPAEKCGSAVTAALRAGGDRRTLRAALTLTDENHISIQVAHQREREELHWLANPIPTQVVDPEISHNIRQFTAEQFAAGQGPLVIRFFQDQGGGYSAFAYIKGQTVGPIALVPFLEAELQSLLTRLDCFPRPFECSRIWESFLEPVFARVFREQPVGTLERVVLIPAGDLFSMPLHTAAVPAKWSGSNEFILLGQWKPLAFSVSLASHVTRNRADLRSCVRHPDDDLFVLFAGENAYRENVDPVFAAAKSWPNPHLFERADANAVRTAAERKPEFLVLQCHGTILSDPQAGGVLALHDGVLSSFGIATRQWLRRNKLTILGACLSGRPVRFQNEKGEINPAGEIAGFIRGFIAAGCGAMLVTNWSVLQTELADVTSQIVHRLADNHAVVRLDELLRSVVATPQSSIDEISSQARIERCVFQLYL